MTSTHNVDNRRHALNRLSASASHSAAIFEVAFPSAANHYRYPSSNYLILRNCLARVLGELHGLTEPWTLEADVNVTAFR